METSQTTAPPTQEPRTPSRDSPLRTLPSAPHDPREMRVCRGRAAQKGFRAWPKRRGRDKPGGPGSGCGSSPASCATKAARRRRKLGSAPRGGPGSPQPLPAGSLSPSRDTWPAHSPFPSLRCLGSSLRTFRDLQVPEQQKLPRDHLDLPGIRGRSSGDAPSSPHSRCPTQKPRHGPEAAPSFRGALESTVPFPAPDWTGP